MLQSYSRPSYGQRLPYTDSGFLSYLRKSKDSVFVIDLSKASTLEIIDEFVKMKSKMHPNYAKSFSTLRLYLSKLEEQFNCRLMPHQITDVFWHNFIPFLTNYGLALSSITKVCSQLRTVLNWGAKHNARISSTFDVIKLPSYTIVFIISLSYWSH